jgi:hypothetical protein
MSSLRFRRKKIHVVIGSGRSVILARTEGAAKTLSVFFPSTDEPQSDIGALTGMEATAKARAKKHKGSCLIVRECARLSVRYELWDQQNLADCRAGFEEAMRLRTVLQRQDA